MTGSPHEGDAPETAEAVAAGSDVGAGAAPVEPGTGAATAASAIGAAGTREGGPVDDSAARIAAERDEYLADLQRLAAEFENYRKRAAREQERLVAHAHERLVRELLPVLDDLERALEAAERHEEAALVDGVRLVQGSLRKALEKEGLVEIATDGVFDPHVHEALLAQPSESAEPGTVLEVVQRGYKVGDRVVRPARVIVAAEPAVAPAAGPAASLPAPPGGPTGPPVGPAAPRDGRAQSGGPSTEAS